MKMKVKVEKKEPKDVVTALICPHCRSTEVYFELGLLTGRKYNCHECGYVGAFVLERRVIVDEDDESVEEI
jgi:predicted RNA-binding Zn-ribbon protein involved in translation (DUF1610 family)